MQKAIVIGCPGSGKSTFSRTLHEKTGLPLYHLDLLYWNSDRTTVSKEVFRERLKAVLVLDRWIIDGNYGSTIEMRMAECDTVFFLDFPLEICIEGVRQRQGKPRPDMPWTETEDDEEFLEFIRNFEAESKPKILSLLQKYKEKNIIVLKSREEAEHFMNSLGGWQYERERFIVKYVIEPLKLDEYSKCSNIWNMETQPLAEKWREEIASGNRLVFIYKINGEFIGEGALVFDTADPDYIIPGKRVYVSRMIIKKEYRNRGIGSEILEFLIRKAKSMGFSEMTIGVDKNNLNALHLYKKYGFTEVLFDGRDENGEYLKLMKRI